MRVLLLAIVALSVLGAPGRPARAEGESPQEPPPQQTTTERGTVSANLVGRWLAVGYVRNGESGERTIPTLFEIARRDGKLVLEMRFADLPAAQKSAIDAANEAQRAWAPTSADLGAIAAAWDQLPALDSKTAAVETEILGRDAFDAALEADAATKDAVWMIRQASTMQPSAAPLIRQAMAFAALAAEGGGWRGNYTFVMIAAAPFPIPITLNGRFELHRVEPQGPLARILDTFRGCSRSPR
ncbi:MAG: hypothetical protein U0807_05050 [Candidatus Binatia bacterium]